MRIREESFFLSSQPSCKKIYIYTHAALFFPRLQSIAQSAVSGVDLCVARETVNGKLSINRIVSALILVVFNRLAWLRKTNATIQQEGKKEKESERNRNVCRGALL